MENNITKNKKIYLLEVWSLSTNEWGDRTKNHRVLMNLVTLADEAYEYMNRDIGITMGFSYSVKSKKEVRESLNRFKKSFNK